MKPYKPVPCAFYDDLALLALKKERVVFMPNIYNIDNDVYIKDIVTKSTKEEVIVLNDGKEIRLDYISSLENNILFLDMSILEEE